MIQTVGGDGRIRTYYSKETVLQTAATLQRCRIPIWLHKFCYEVSSMLNKYTILFIGKSIKLTNLVLFGLIFFFLDNYFLFREMAGRKGLEPLSPGS